MIYVTTVLGASGTLVQYAKERARILGYPYCTRRPNFEHMRKEAGDSFLVYGKDGPMLTDGYPTDDGIHGHSFHTGTAKLRLLQLARGGHDRLIDLLPAGTSSVLDATYGEGKDSLVLSYALGGGGRVTSLEKSKALWEIGRWGISHFEDKNPEIAKALRRIHLLHVDFHEFLGEAEPGSFDVVYFDTMFREPVKKEENNRDAFRMGACYDLLDLSTLRLAEKAARRCVIVKERPFSSLFRMDIFDAIYHKRGQTTAYGVILCGEHG